MSPFHRLEQEDLSCVLGMLGIEGVHFLLGEVAQGQRLSDNIKRTGGVGTGRASAGKLIIPHIAHAHQRQGPGKDIAEVIIALADLPKHGDENRTFEGIDFVDEQHQGFRSALAPCGEAIDDFRAGGRIWPRRRLLVGGKGMGGTASNAIEDGELGHGRIVNIGACAFDRKEEGAELPLCDKLLSQGFDEGGFAGLAGRVDYKIELSIDKRAKLGQAGENGQGIVFVWVVGARGIKETRHG